MRVTGNVYPLITILKTEGQFGKDYNLHPGEINRRGAQGQTGFYYVINRPFVNDLLKDVESNLSISDPAQIALAKQTLISVVEKIYELIKMCLHPDREQRGPQLLDLEKTTSSNNSKQILQEAYKKYKIEGKSVKSVRELNLPDRVIRYLEHTLLLLEVKYFAQDFQQPPTFMPHFHVYASIPVPSSSASPTCLYPAPGNPR